MTRLLAMLVLAACAPAWKATPHDQLFQIHTPAKLFKAPVDSDPSDWWNKGEMLFVRPLGRLLSPGTYVEKLIGGPPARDVNRLGQVPDSAWFENRISRHAYTFDETVAGAANDAGLAPGVLAVISGKLEGVSAGFVVRDTASQVWFLKLDHPGFPELSTSAEVISSRLLWLAGYHVPSMHVIDLEIARLVLDPKAKTRDDYRRTIPLTASSLRDLLVNANPGTTGRVRVLISRQPPGKVLGPFRYRSVRVDDPNDTIPHEDRRSLRGLWLFSAWLNNNDTRDQNTLDVFRPTTPDGRGFIKHYLIDFGDAFGSTGLGEKAAMEGWENIFDWHTTFLNLVSLGLRSPQWRKAQRSSVRAVGLFEAKVFEPAKWRPELPNPAFGQRTPDDNFWAASILARIQPEQIRAAVMAGRYSEDGAVTYVVQTLLERRRKLLEYAFEGFLELDRPRADRSMLQLDNLRDLGGLPPKGPFQYAVRWNRTRRADRELARGSVSTEGPVVALDLTAVLAAHRTDLADDPFLTVELSRMGTKLEVHLRVTGDRIVPITVER